MIFNKILKIILGAIFALILGAGFLFAYINGVFAPFVEKITNETPEAKISAYLQAVSRGDKETAFSFWERPVSGASSEYKTLVEERKQKAINEFIDAKISSDFKIINTEWWTTCCVPSILKDSNGAGRAVITAELQINNEKKVYVFNVFAEGYEPPIPNSLGRHWAISDVNFSSSR